MSASAPSTAGASRRWLLLLALGGAALACSTLADTPDPEECRSDADCIYGDVCAVDQGRCLPGNEAAPRAHLGFDVRERPGGAIRFRVEIDGCDCTVEEAENIRELSVRGPQVSQTFLLDATVLSGPVGLEELVPLVSRFELTQTSRHHQDVPLTNGANHPTFAQDDSQEVTKVRWPRYHPLDERVPSDLVLWEIRPSNANEGEPDLALRYLGIRPPRTDKNRPCEVDSDCCEPTGDCNPAPNFCDTTVGECSALGPAEWTYGYVYDRVCSRGLDGEVITPVPTKEMMSVPLAGATVSLRHADGEVDGEVERLGIPVLSNPVTCESDGDCQGPDEYCDPTAQECFVALAGRPADGGSTTDDTGQFYTQVFTYCDPDDLAVTRRFVLTVQPNEPRPTVEYLVDVPYSPANFNLSRLCVPDWGQGTTLQLAFEGQPRALAGTDGEYTCCDVGCLPATANDAAAGPPVAPETCDGTSAGVAPLVSLESHFVFDQATRDAWEAADCVMPNEDADGRVGSLALTASCTDPTDPDAPCRVEGMALGTEEAPRRYTVRFESEPGSVLASRDFEIELGPTAPALETLALTPRVLVTGFVDVDPVVCGRRPNSGDCAAREAVVLAERLRLPDEPEGSVPGPYFHSVTTVYDPVAQRDGAFVLPLDPGGVYVLTALPLAGAEGGPARFTLVDLRGATTVEPKRLVLEDGVVVTLRLEQFDQRTTVIPLDRGSYRTSENSLQLPELAGTNEIIDLDEVGACWSVPKEGPVACRIRRLIPPGYDLARSQVGVVRFTARRSNEAQCSVRCPMADPAQ
jgi:hypothetical protein